MATPAENYDHHIHLELTEGREVVFCHQCSSQWYRDELGLVCPTCEGEITEIVSDEFDPRPPPPIQRPPTPPGFTALRSHYPFAQGYDSDPAEADIEEHITEGPGGSRIFTRTVRSSTPLRGAANRRGRETADEDDVMANFQGMVANMMGPQLRTGPRDRSGVEFMYSSDNNPHVTGARWTFSSMGGQAGPRGDNGQQPGPHPPAIDLASLLGGIFNNQPGHDQNGGPQPGLPPGLANLQGLFAAMLNPANARSGDAVYTQEALDNIISQLMEQNATSSAPGPASAAAIESLPKIRLDEKLLGPERKGECSVCMDDVTVGDEVVLLPCKHWFHQECASVWLKEHNTCPICRKGIDGDAEGAAGAGAGPSQAQGQSQNQSQRSPFDHVPSRRLSYFRRTSSPLSNPAATPRDMGPILMNDAEAERARRVARLESIRNTAGLPPSGGNNFPQPARVEVVSDGHSHGRASASTSTTAPPPPRRLLRDHSRSHITPRMEQAREARRRGDLPGTPTRRHTQPAPTPIRRSNTQANAQDVSAVGVALGWLRDRLAPSGSSSNNERDPSGSRR